MWVDEKKGRKSVYRQGTVQRPDRDQSEPEGQEESSFWKRELEEEGEAGEVEGSQILLGSRGPGNRGPTECGTTHEATSGMSS